MKVLSDAQRRERALYALHNTIPPKLFFFSFFKVYFYLKDREEGKERHKENKEIIHLLVHSPRDQSWAEPKSGNRSQEPAPSSGASDWVQGLKDLDHALYATQATSQQLDMEAEHLGHKLMSIWDPGTGRWRISSLRQCDSPLTRILNLSPVNNNNNNNKSIGMINLQLRSVEAQEQLELFFLMGNYFKCDVYQHLHVCDLLS